MTKYYMFKEFEVEGDGSFEKPFSAKAGTTLNCYAYLANLLELDSAFFAFGVGTKAFARRYETGWKVVQLTNLQVSEDEAAAFLNNGLNNEYFKVEEAPENPVVISKGDLKILVDQAYAARQMGVLATPEEVAVSEKMTALASS